MRRVEGVPCSPHTDLIADMLAKANHYHQLTLILDNFGGVLAWLLSIYLGLYADSFTHNAFYPYAALLILIIPTQAWAFYTYYDQRLSVRAQAIYLTKSLLTVLMVLVAGIFITQSPDSSRLVILSYPLIAFAGLLSAKLFLYYWYFHGRKEKLENYTKVLIVGSGPRAEMISNKLNKVGDWGVQIIGYVDPEADPNATPQEGLTVPHADVEHTGDILDILSKNVVDEVIIAMPRRFLTSLEPLVQTCQAEGICVRLVADLFDIDSASVTLSMLDDVPIIEYHTVSQNINMLIVKRIFDLGAILLALPILVPLFIIIGIVVKLDSRGPVFFSQTRIGLNKRSFRMFKFRSMFEDAEERMAEVEHLNEADGPNFKIANDPRVTRAGKFLRKTSLDELPQLINVFIGHMSLVGPRPMSVRDVNLFDNSAQRRRFSVRPGCTCTWQISGRSNLSFEQWLALDLAYIDQWSFAGDVKILFKTIPSVVKGSGAV